MKDDLRRGWEEFKVALGFLTILPVEVKGEIDPPRLARSMGLFPAVGIAMGLALVVIDWLLSGMIPRPVLDCLLILIMIAATGALHLDGIADLIDGLAGGKDREHVLEIMKDSRVGAIGVVGLVMVLLLKYLSLSHTPLEAKSAALILMPAMGRWMQVCLAHFCDYVRREGSRAGSFVSLVGERELQVATATVVVAALVLLGFAAIPFLLVLALGSWGLIRYFTLRLGGVTGDVLGAGTELAEVATLVVILAVV